MITTILFSILCLLALFYGIAAVFTLNRTGRYRNMMTDMDSERVATSPFQRSVSMVVTCDSDDVRLEEKVKLLLMVNYLKFDVILLVNSSRNKEVLGRLLQSFRMKSSQLPADAAALEFPPRAIYRTDDPVYHRLVVVDKILRGPDDTFDTGMAISNMDYILPIGSTDSQLMRNCLIRLVVMTMREPAQDVVRVRGVVRYCCDGVYTGRLFTGMSDLGNLRRMYAGGAVKNNDFGQYIVLDRLPEMMGREEFVPKPLVYLHCPDCFTTYFKQLKPGLRRLSSKGRFFAAVELLVSLLFWTTGVLLCAFPDKMAAVMLMLSTYLLVSVFTAFSIFAGEILLRRKYDPQLVGLLALLSFPESLAFCLLAPFAWLADLFNVPRKG